MKKFVLALALGLGLYSSVSAHRCVYPAYTTYYSYPTRVVYQEPVCVEYAPPVEYVAPVYVRPVCYRPYRPCRGYSRGSFGFSFGVGF